MAQSSKAETAQRGLLNERLPRSAARAIVLGTLVILLAIWSSGLWSIFRDRAGSLQSGRETLRLMAAGLSMHIEAMLADGVGSAIAGSNEINARGGVAGLSDSELQEVLRRMFSGGEYVRELFLVAPERVAGAHRGGSGSFTALPESAVADLRASTGDTWVGEAIYSGQELLVPIGHRVPDGAGGTLWVGALFGVDSLYRVYRDLQLDHGVVALLSSGGQILLRIPAPEEGTEVRRNAGSQELFRRAAAAQDRSFVEGTSPISGQYYIYARQRITGYPLLAVTGREQSFMLAPWRSRTATTAGIMAAASALIVLLGWLLRKQAIALERRDSHYRTLFNNSAVSVFLMQGSRFLEANETTFRMFSISGDKSIRGVHPWELSPERQPDGELSEIRARQQIGRALSEGRHTFRWLHKRMDSGQPFAAEVSLSSLTVDGSSLMLAIVHDISELEQARSQLETLNADLERRVDERTAELQRANLQLAVANNELEAFTASASHDLRSPLSSIAGQAGLLAMDLGASLTEEARGRLQRIQASVNRMSEIIDGLLSLAKLSRQELLREPVDLSSMAAVITAELRQQYPQAAVDFSVREELKVMADPRLMKSLLTNLLGNAWKYTSKTASPQVRLELEAGNDGIPVYKVRDNGVGFDMAYADKLFQPFRRLHSASEFPGVGIGLATVARVVQRYGGRIWADSEPGKGTTFHFTLPSAHRPAA